MFYFFYNVIVLVGFASYIYICARVQLLGFLQLHSAQKRLLVPLPKQCWQIFYMHNWLNGVYVYGCASGRNSRHWY